MSFTKSTTYKVTITNALSPNSWEFNLPFLPSPRDLIELLNAERDEIGGDYVYENGEPAYTDDEEGDRELLRCLAEVVKHGPKKLECKVGETQYPIIIAGVGIGSIVIEPVIMHSRGRRAARKRPSRNYRA